jgi:hypothetical protein
MKILVICWLVMASALVKAQSFNVLLIPDSLKKNAGTVVREEVEILEIKSPAKAIVKRNQVLTILNEQGDNNGGFVSSYDKFSSINSISGTLYDAVGKEQKHMKKKDMEDRSYVSEGNLMDDDRYKAYDFYCRNYPYTVNFEEEKELTGILGFHDWAPLWGSGISTQHSKYVIVAPRDYQVRFKPVNCNFQPVITESGDKKIYTWEAWNLRAMHTETAGPRWKEISPYVLVAPSDFEAEGYKGNMSTWENYGKFINQLRTGRDMLPEDIKKKVHELTDNLKDTRQKIFVLYDFLQKNTHYISIQLGIGGLQPFPADYVATKRYGDCKALSNYMIALLKEAGIKGKYVEIEAGEGASAMIEDFPSFQSNHVITCVPMGKDTIWLECTSQTGAPGYMGSATGDRKAILTDEDGGHIVRTPSYTAADNLQCRVVKAEINAEGNLEAEVNTLYTGIQQELPNGLMNEITPEQRQKYLNNLFHLPTYQVDKSHYEEQKGMIPVVKEYLHVVSPNYASVSGKRLFITPNLFDRSDTRLAIDSVRKYDFIDNEAFRDIDSILIKIPAGYTTESIPQDVNIDSPFGRYTASVRVDGDKIIYYRKREESIKRFPPSEYSGIVQFYEQLYKADHNKVVLVKKE